jgi:hypothetical protein
MANQPRKHHFIPQFYLAGFTASDRKDGVLYVLDKEQHIRWKSTPKGSAHKRDFHAVDLGQDEDAMVVEKGLAEMEGRWSEMLRSVIATATVPQDEAFKDLMLFIAFMFARVPQIRKTLSAFTAGLLGDLNALMLSSPQGLARFRRQIEDNKNRALSDGEFDKIVAAGLEGHFEFDFEQTWYVEQMLWMSEKLAPILAKRKWQIWKVASDAPDLICSDRPVAPTWLQEQSVPLSPSFGTPNTIVSIPMNRRLVIVSLLEEEIGPITLDRNGVAAVNSMTALYANQLYSSGENFVWLTNDGHVKEADELLVALRVQDTPSTS